MPPRDEPTVTIPASMLERMAASGEDEARVLGAAAAAVAESNRVVGQAVIIMERCQEALENIGPKRIEAERSVAREEGFAMGKRAGLAEAADQARTARIAEGVTRLDSVAAWAQSRGGSAALGALLSWLLAAFIAAATGNLTWPPTPVMAPTGADGVRHGTDAAQ